MTRFEEFGRQPHTHARGRSAEQAGVEWLERAGYRVLARNLSTPAGEIDAIALDGDVLCFVEIKARASGSHGPAVAAVGPRKQRRLVRAAALYLAGAPYGGPCRFDVLGLDPGGEGWEFTLLKGAFEAA